MSLVDDCYKSTSEDEEITNTQHQSTSITTNKQIISAPDVQVQQISSENYQNNSETILKSNPKAKYLYAPISGPLRNSHISRNDEFKKQKNTLTGYMENHEMDEFTFNEQYHTYQSFGYALDPSKGINVNCLDKQTFIGDKVSLKQNKAMTVFNQSNKMVKMKKKNKKRKRVKSGDPSDIEGYQGPWAPLMKTKEEQEAYARELEERRIQWKAEHPETENGANKKRKLNDNNNNNSDNDDSSNEKETNEEKQAKKEKEIQEQILLESNIFHDNMNNKYDYQGRTFMYCDNVPKKCDKNYIPKKCIKTLIGHKKGVNAIQWLPKSGHLLLSASNDGTVKIWDVFKDNKCLMTYKGHTKGVRNICFNKSGTRFLTTSYDKWIKLWDTETGKVIWRGTSGKYCYDATLHPDRENEFLCGQKNKIAVQWSMRANKIVQIYSEHLMSVNTVTFIDNNNRFITTSDDKKIFIWDYGIPIVIKHISEPSLHSVPYVTLHKNKKWFLGQSMNNTIIVYSTQGRFTQNTKKLFKGHLNAGIAAQIDVSYDGKYVMSGDVNGKLFFWDWKTNKIVNKPIKAHDKVTMGCIWHPLRSSLVATCSWDCKIKLWD